MSLFDQSDKNSLVSQLIVDALSSQSQNIFQQKIENSLTHLSYRNFASLIINDVTWKQVFSQIKSNQSAVDSARLRHLPKFKYPSKKAYQCPFPTDFDNAVNVYFEFKVSKVVSWSKTIHIELNESHFKLIVQLTRLTPKHAKIQMYCDDFDFQTLINPKKLLLELVKHAYSQSWSQAMQSEIKDLVSIKSPKLQPGQTPLMFGKEGTPNFKTPPRQQSP